MKLSLHNKQNSQLDVAKAKFLYQHYLLIAIARHSNINNIAKKGFKQLKTDYEFRYNLKYLTINSSQILNCFYLEKSSTFKKELNITKNKIKKFCLKNQTKRLEN